MIEPRADFLIIGSTPLARLVAGLLASTHRKSVALLASSDARYRLAQGIDLSTGPITRPETWALLKKSVPIVGKTLSRLAGRDACRRVDAVMFADDALGHEGLSHIRHMGAAFGLPVERVESGALGHGREAIVLRDSIVLDRVALEQALGTWLDSVGVRRLPANAQPEVRPDGGADIRLGDTVLPVGQTILADDDALLVHLPAPLWPETLVRQRRSTILTESVAPLFGAIMHRLDSGLTLWQHAARTVTAFGPGEFDAVSTSMHALLGSDDQVRHAGQTSYDCLVSLDQAPAVGRTNGTGPDILAGFGPIGVFFAPMLARWLCGVASDAENDWLAARLCNRSPHQSNVAEWGATS